MQKPQQRKYHSSCNRSVHRGTAHGKQRVKVCKRKTPHLLMRSFLSPYGDGTWNVRDQTEETLFSPPYGDGTDVPMVPAVEKLFSPPSGDDTFPFAPTYDPHAFSPPYGDGTDAEDKANAEEMFSPPYGDGTIWDVAHLSMREFSPPYGDSTDETFGYQEAWAFPSPCGDKLQRLRGKSPREGQAFAPLTGIVPRATQLRKRSRRYRPLTGMVLRGF